MRGTVSAPRGWICEVVRLRVDRLFSASVSAYRVPPLGDPGGVCRPLEITDEAKRFRR